MEIIYYPLDELICRAAAAYGNLEHLRYRHEHGCTWDQTTCESAARYDHLKCLRYVFSMHMIMGVHWVI